MNIRTSSLVIALLLNQSEAIRVNTLKNLSATPEEMEAYNKIKADSIRASLKEAEELNVHENDLLASAMLKGDQLTRAENQKLKGLDLTSPQAEINNPKLVIQTDKPLSAKAQKEEPVEEEKTSSCNDEKDSTCDCGSAEKFEKLSKQFKKVSDVVENASILGKYQEEDFECLKQEYKDAVSFITKEEKELKKKEEFSTLDAKDKSDFLIASNHHGVVGLSQHISKLLDEVYDFQGVIKRFKAQKEPKEEVVTLVEDIQKDIVNLCKYDQERCDGWKKAEELKVTKAKEKKANETKLEDLKGGDNDPSLKMGPGGPIPKGSDEIAAESKAFKDKKELEAAKKKEADEKNPNLEAEACSKCNELKKKQEEKDEKLNKIEKIKDEKYDTKYKDKQKDQWDSKDHNKDEKVANPTVNRFDKDALEKGKKNSEEKNGKNGDGDKKNTTVTLATKLAVKTPDTIATEQQEKEKKDAIAKSVKEGEVAMSNSAKAQEQAAKTAVENVGKADKAKEQQRKAKAANKTDTGACKTCEKIPLTKDEKKEEKIEKKIAEENEAKSLVAKQSVKKDNKSTKVEAKK